MHPNIHSWRPAEAVLYFIDDALSRASFDWISVEKHIDHLTQHDATIIFRQEIPNSVLFNDRNFSKTKDYYWATKVSDSASTHWQARYSSGSRFGKYTSKTYE